jgi:hypothetical protein
MSKRAFRILVAASLVFECLVSALDYFLTRDIPSGITTQLQEIFGRSLFDSSLLTQVAMCVMLVLVLWAYGSLLVLAQQPTCFYSALRGDGDSGYSLATVLCLPWLAPRRD